MEPEVLEKNFALRRFFALPADLDLQLDL